MRITINLLAGACTKHRHGVHHTRSCILDLVILIVPQAELWHLIAPFVEDKIYGVVMDMQPDKAPMLDGFTVCFFQVSCLIIKHDHG